MISSIEILGNWIEIVGIVIGLTFVGVQIRQNNKISKGNFINTLVKDGEKFFDIEARMEPGGDLFDEKEEISPKDYVELLKFLSFFGHVQYLIEHDLLNLTIVDRLFVYRFFVLVNNLNVRKFILDREDQVGYWNGVETLTENLRTIRQKTGLEIPFDKAIVTDD